MDSQALMNLPVAIMLAGLFIGLGMAALGGSLERIAKILKGDK